VKSDNRQPLSISWKNRRNKTDSFI